MKYSWVILIYYVWYDKNFQQCDVDLFLGLPLVRTDCINIHIGVSWVLKSQQGIGVAQRGALRLESRAGMVQMECFCIKTSKKINTWFYFLLSPLVEKRVKLCFTVQNLVLNLFKIWCAIVSNGYFSTFISLWCLILKKKKKPKGRKSFLLMVVRAFHSLLSFIGQGFLWHLNMSQVC